MAMRVGIGRRWAALVARRQARSKQVRLTWQTCRRCGSYSLRPAGSDDQLCGGCLSLQ